MHHAAPSTPQSWSVQLDVPRGVGEVPQHERARRVAGRRQPLDVERLAGREVDAAQEQHGEVRAVLGDGGLEVAAPEGGITRPWLDDDQVRLRVEPARREVARQGMPVGREERAVGEDPAAAPHRPEERREQQVEVDRQRVEHRDLRRSRADDPGERLAQRVVEREPWPVALEERVDAMLGPAVELGGHGRADGSRLEPERLAGEVDRWRAAGLRRRGRQAEPVADRGQRVGGVARESVCLRVRGVGHRRIARRVVSPGAGSAGPRARRPR